MSAVGSGSSTESPLTVVKGLVRPHLQYDEEQGTYRRIRSIGSIVGTHGADIDSVVRLARDGVFSGGLAPDLEDPSRREFFATPNKHYGRWNETVVGRTIGGVILSHGGDAIARSIEYSETGDVAVTEHAVKGLYHGVVIAFNDTVLTAQTTLSEDLINGDQELVLPAAPALGAIEGIYPVTAAAETVLGQALSELQ